ncbi:GAF domain-containing protein [Dactylosporangium cerinum]
MHYGNLCHRDRRRCHRCSADRHPRETIYSSNRLASEAEELSLILGEGPCVDALAGGLALVPDLSTTHCLARWPVFAPAVVAAGVRAIFALPLQVGAIRLGVLDLYRAEPGDLHQEQLLDALTLADTACALLLDGTGHGAPQAPGRILEPAGLQHPEVHQATGMISVQLGLSAALALVRLRAYAYVNDRRLRDVARDVVARRLRFDPEGSDDSGRSDGD